MAHFVKFYSFGLKKKKKTVAEKKMAEIPWTEEPWRATAHGVAKELDMT